MLLLVCQYSSVEAWMYFKETGLIEPLAGVYEDVDETK